MKNGVFSDVTPHGSRKNRRFAFCASFIRVTRINELGTMLAVTSNKRTLRRNKKSYHPDEGGAKFLRNVGSYKSHKALTSQKTQFFGNNSMISSRLEPVTSWLVAQRLDQLHFHMPLN
jgi:hypothetical protein